MRVINLLSENNAISTYLRNERQLVATVFHLKTPELSPFDSHPKFRLTFHKLPTLAPVAWASDAR
jgi:hypothetical protein